jgi:hypothetical protein
MTRATTVSPWRWHAYSLLLLLRVLACVGLLGMVHPDEFFQSQEVMARHVVAVADPLHDQLLVPWEYRLPTPNRSVLVPYVDARQYGFHLYFIMMLS